MNTIEARAASTNATQDVSFDERTTSDFGHLDRRDSRLHAGVSRIGSPADDAVSHRVFRHGGKADPKFIRLITDSTHAVLRATFREEFREFDSVSKRVKRSEGALSLHPAFRSFANFLLDIGPIPTPTHSVDRLNPFDGEYGPGKVRWASPAEQAENQRDRVEVRGADGAFWTISDLSRLHGVQAGTLRKRRERGWSDAEIVAGRRLSGQATRNAPAREKATPVSDRWPAGLPEKTQARWAEPLRWFREIVPGASRVMFTAFALPYDIACQESRVRVAFPQWGPDHDPDADPPEGYLSIPAVAALWRMRDMQDKAFWSLSAAQHATLRACRTSPALADVRERLASPSKLTPRRQRAAEDE
jgi:hypothetical protein